MQLNSTQLSLQDRDGRQDNLLRPQPTHRLHGEEELPGLGCGVVGRVIGPGTGRVDVAAEGGVGGEGPFLVDVLFGPVGGVTEDVVRVVLKSNGCRWTPLCMFLPDSLYT